MKKLVVPAILAMLATSAAAQKKTDFEPSGSRDAAATYVSTANFVVNKMAEECLPLLHRPEKPEEIVAAWQKRNAQYYAASFTYMNLRVKAAEMKGGAAAKDKVVQEFTRAVRGKGQATVDETFKNGEKTAVCKKWVDTINSGIFDIKSDNPMYDELNALVKYFE